MGTRETAKGKGQKVARGDPLAGRLMEGFGYTASEDGETMTRFTLSGVDIPGGRRAVILVGARKNETCGEGKHGVDARGPLILVKMVAGVFAGFLQKLWRVEGDSSLF